MSVTKHRGRRKRVGMVLVATLGLILIAAVAFLISPGVRAVYVGALERPGTCDRLAGMLADRDTTVRLAALDALVRRGLAAVPAVARHLVDATDAEGRALAAVGLDRIGPPARDALPVLYRRMRDDPDAGVREAVIRATASGGGGAPEVVAALAGLLGDGDEAGRLGAVRALD